MRKQSVLIHVEGDIDQSIVRGLLALVAGKKHLPHVEIKVHGGLKQLERHISDAPPETRVTHLALIDSDINSVADARQHAQKKAFNSMVSMYCAVPTVEAWLFADLNAASKHARAGAQVIIEQLPLPEMIPYPKQLANNVFKAGYREDRACFISSLLQDMDLATAIARSPSLREFVRGLQAALRIEPLAAVDDFLSTSVSRDAFTSLLQELPREKVVWKTLDGSLIDAQQLVRDVYEGTEIGKQYVSEVLRVSRDMIARKAQK